MAGVAHGCVNLYLGPSVNNQAKMGQVVFTSIYNLVASHPSASIESVFYGNTGLAGEGDGLGTGYWWETNSFRGGAFFVVKMPANSNRDFDYWWLCQYKNGTEISPSIPVSWQNSTGTNGMVGFSCCAVSGSTENPWNGTFDLTGSAAKGNPVWLVSSGTLLPLPASNNTGDIHATSKQNLIYVGPIQGSVVSNEFVHFVMDDDAFVFLGDSSPNAGQYQTYFFGSYNKSVIQSGSNNLVMFSGAATNQTLNLGGSVATTAGGVVVGITGSNYVFSLIITTDPQLQSLNNYFDGHFLYGKQVEQNINLWSNTTSNQGFAGIFGGDGELFGHSFRMPNESISSDGTRAYFGYQARNNKKIGIPWSGSAPGTAFSRTGSFF